MVLQAQLGFLIPILTSLWGAEDPTWWTTE